MTKELKQTWLIQRLNPPYPGSIANAFAFGGGLKNGGFSDKAMELLKDIFSFDYMGSSEFEWGAIPNFFRTLADNITDYQMGQIEINDMSVYFLAPKKIISLVEERIAHISKHPYGYKESPNFSAALGLDKYYKKEDCRTIGWLELDNVFCFFTDKKAFSKLCNLLGLSEEK